MVWSCVHNYPPFLKQLGDCYINSLLMIYNIVVDHCILLPGLDQVCDDKCLLLFANINACVNFMRFFVACKDKFFAFWSSLRCCFPGVFMYAFIVNTCKCLSFSIRLKQFSVQKVSWIMLRSFVCFRNDSEVYLHTLFGRKTLTLTSTHWCSFLWLEQ